MSIVPGHFPDAEHQIITQYGVFNLANPKVQDVTMEDMLIGTGNLCRYTGHSKEFYSVLGHSLFCHDLAGMVGYDTELQFECLTHDLHEAYVGDLSSPMKRLIDAPYREVEHKVEAVVRQFLELEPRINPEAKKQVRVIDLAAARAEMNYFFKGNEAYGKVDWGTIPLFEFDKRYVDLGTDALIASFWDRF